MILQKPYLRDWPVSLPPGQDTARIDAVGSHISVIETNAKFIIEDDNGSSFEIDRARSIGPLPGEFRWLNIRRKPGHTGPIKAVLSLGNVPVRDGRTQITADLATPPVLTTLTVPAPLSWRIVPHIRHELTMIDGVPSHQWTEEPGRGSVYGGYFAPEEVFFSGNSAGICIALANPRVKKRRIRLLDTRWQANPAEYPDLFNWTTPVENPDARVLIGPCIPASTGWSGGFVPSRPDCVPLTAAAPLEIDGGSALFMGLPGEYVLSGNLLTRALIIEEWFWPESIALPGNLAGWPASGAPAPWGRMIAPATSGNTGTAPDLGANMGPQEGPSDTPTAESGTPGGPDTPQNPFPEVSGEQAMPSTELWFSQDEEGAQENGFIVTTAGQSVGIGPGSWRTVVELTRSDRAILGLLVNGVGMPYAPGQLEVSQDNNYMVTISVIYDAGAPATTNGPQSPRYAAVRVLTLWN